EAGAINPCRLQIVLHGCLQSAEALGDVFYSRIGVTEWADSKRDHCPLSAGPRHKARGDSAQSGNPNGCWNWWGYADDRQYLTKKGVQVLAIWKMVQRLEGK